jgi:hypothetical protein
MEEMIRLDDRRKVSGSDEKQRSEGDSSNDSKLPFSVWEISLPATPSMKNKVASLKNAGSPQHILASSPSCDRFLFSSTCSSSPPSVSDYSSSPVHGTLTVRSAVRTKSLSSTPRILPSSSSPVTSAYDSPGTSRRSSSALALKLNPEFIDPELENDECLHTIYSKYPLELLIQAPSYCSSSLSSLRSLTPEVIHQCVGEVQYLISSMPKHMSLKYFLLSEPLYYSFIKNNMNTLQMLISHTLLLPSFSYLVEYIVKRFLRARFFFFLLLWCCYYYYFKWLE